MAPATLMTPDSELLRQYAHEGDEDAFAEIVCRHANLVYSVALRVAGNGAFAEDATQLVFTKLARQAGRLSGYDTIVGWLHTTTRHEALNAVRGEGRRRAREQEAFAMQQNSSASDVNWEQLQPALDEAIEALPEDDRKAVLLRFFKNQSHQEIGATLGLSEDTARKRGERALEKLRVYFTRRGVTASSAALAAAIGANSVQAAPAGLVAEVTKASLAGVGGAVGETFLLTLLMSTKIKIILAAVVLLAIGAAFTFSWRSMNRSPSAVSSSAAPIPAAKAQTPAPGAPIVTPIAPAVISGTAQTPAPRASIVAPVAPAVDSRTTPAPQSTPGPDAQEFVAGAKPELKDAIATGIYFLGTKDVPGLVKTLGSQAMQQDLMEAYLKAPKGADKEAMLAQMRAQPLDADKLLAQQLEVFRAIKDMTPEISADGKRARYRLNAPIGDVTEVIFTQLGSNWIYNANGIPAAWFDAAPRAGGAGGSGNGSNFGQSSAAGGPAPAAGAQP